MDELTPFSAPVLPGQEPWFGALSVLAERPGRILELMDRRFRVVRPWPDFGPQGIAGRPILLAWQVGTEGVVSCIQFSDNAWVVQAEIQDPDGHFLGGLELDEIYAEIPLQRFLRCTAPIEPLVPQLLPEAANDH